EPLIEPLGDGAFRVPGKMPVPEVNELLPAELPEHDDWDTIGGLVLARAGHVPGAGEAVTVGPYRLTVERVVGRRIGVVRVERLGGGDAAAPAGQDATGVPAAELG
ncbi:MAG TPA: transporter associated domain-containing protein, partial [Acidimicrobiales bacterium]|nr:transporter associated domain-containing protein [Acidimicrobiales bacterium]